MFRVPWSTSTIIFKRACRMEKKARNLIRPDFWFSISILSYGRFVLNHGCYTDVHTGIQTQYLLLTSPGSLPPDCIVIECWGKKKKEKRVPTPGLNPVSSAYHSKLVIFRLHGK